MSGRAKKIAWVVLAPAGIAGGTPAGTCDTSDYTLTGAVMTVTADVPLGFKQGAWAGATNQDACKGGSWVHRGKGRDALNRSVLCGHRDKPPTTRSLGAGSLLAALMLLLTAASNPPAPDTRGSSPSTFQIAGEVRSMPAGSPATLLCEGFGHGFWSFSGPYGSLRSAARITRVKTVS
ncbi:hypothetical protein AAGW05_13320 [Arthrobacter sp. LAPM80]|uniref:hypothetical protein n=1 Tax=Arthrobacter sp. LAPM80 TaxID=3141788 RepID=UPI00398BA060